MINSFKRRNYDISNLTLKDIFERFSFIEVYFIPFYKEERFKDNYFVVGCDNLFVKREKTMKYGFLKYEERKWIRYDDIDVYFYDF